MQLKWETATLLLSTVKEPSHEKCQKKNTKAWQSQSTRWSLGQRSSHPWLLTLLWRTWPRFTREGGSDNTKHPSLLLSIGIRHKSKATEEPFLSSAFYPLQQKQTPYATIIFQKSQTSFVFICTNLLHATKIGFSACELDLDDLESLPSNSSHSTIPCFHYCTTFSRLKHLEHENCMDILLKIMPDFC